MTQEKDTNFWRGELLLTVILNDSHLNVCLVHAGPSSCIVYIQAVSKDSTVDHLDQRRSHYRNVSLALFKRSLKLALL